MPLTRRALASAVAVAPLGALLRRSAPARAQAEPLAVLATFSILGDVVRTVGGDRIALEVLVGPDSDAHTFEPSPADIAEVADAALIIENGLGFEGWLGDVYEASGSAATRVPVAEGLPGLLDAEGHPHDGAEDEGHAGGHGDDASPATGHGQEAGHDGEEADHHGDEEEDHHGDEEEDHHGDEEEDDHGEEGEGGHHHGETDPHVWHDVRNVVAEVDVIRDALAAADPANAGAYEANAAAYAAELGALHEEVLALAGTLPAERRRLVTSHDALGYLAAAYGFEIVGTALGSLSTETADPSAGEIAALVEQIRASGVPAIFAETIEGRDLMGQIAADAGVALAPPLYTDALGEPGGEAGTYVAMVRHNMATIVAALGGGAA